MSQKNGKLRNVLLTHNKNETAIKENVWWKGMILLPWANRIAQVKNILEQLSKTLSTYSARGSSCISAWLALQGQRMTS